MDNSLDFKIWANSVATILYGSGYIITDDAELWDELQFLFEDDVAPQDAVAHILS